MGKQPGSMSMALIALVVGATGCMDSNEEPAEAGGTGQTEFVSADPGGPARVRGAGGTLTVAAGESTNAADSSTDTRTVERGDIYRVLGDGRILNLNSFRGLQVIDVRDPSMPSIEGRLALTGQPVEMYVVDNRAVVLLNNYQGYYGTRDDVRVQSVAGGLVLLVDISDRKAPKELDRAVVPGSIQTSRLTQGGGHTALYIAGNFWETQTVSSGGGVAVSTGSGTTVVKSLAVEGDSFVEKSELDLGGYVTDIQATTDYLMVARNDYSQSTEVGSVALIDISSPDGTMVEGQDVLTRGLVQNKFNMDIRGSVMRIVSGSLWNGVQTNHLETFDITDIAQVRPIAYCSFGDSEDLFATLFLEESAFFVTYFRTDPFHAFAIDAAGNCEEKSEFIVSGWNDFFRSTANDSRLIGIGKNDETSTRKLAVSLYDITDLSNPNPLLARAEIDIDGAYSEASWDDRAFSVLEDAVSVAAADGTEETGLILLPFSGWDSTSQRSIADVQIFTFSPSTLTQRGVMHHGSDVRRSFLASADTAANLSDPEISLFDTSNPDNPSELGRLELAPNYSQVFVFGNYLARVKDPNFYYGYYYNVYGVSQTATVEIIEISSDPNTSDTVASFEIPSATRLKQVNDLLVSVSMLDTTNYNVSQPKPSFDTTVQVVDLSNPKQPRAAGEFKTDQLAPAGSGYYYGGSQAADVSIAIDCIDCGGSYYGGYWGGYNDGIHVAGDALVFAEPTQQQESLGLVEYCYEYASDTSACTYDATTGAQTCPEFYYSGSVNCRTPKDGETVCTGEFYRCSYTTGECKVAQPETTQRYCNEYEDFRYWNSYTFEVLDLSNPDQPHLAPTIAFPKSDEGTSVVAAGAKVYFNFQQPIDVENDPRPFVKHYVSVIDVQNPSAPAVSDDINIPGEVIEAQGSTIFARDLVWNNQQTETMVARLALEGGKAHLQAQQAFSEREVSAVKLDGAGHVLVSHDPRWSVTTSQQNLVHTLSILDDSDLSVVGEVDVDSWATFQVAKAGRAIYTVSGGILILNTEDPALPHAQAYFPTMGGGDIVLEDGALLFAAGPYGVYRFDIDTYNLSSK